MNGVLRPELLLLSCAAMASASCRDWGFLDTDPATGGTGGCGADACNCPAFWRGPTCSTCVVHVLVTGDDAQDGGAWRTAKATVQGAIGVAAERVAAGLAPTCEVWVGGGTYVPTTGEGRAATLRLSPAVHVYGGFSGNEASRDQRDFLQFQTILSGDVLQNDVPGDPSTNRSDNLYHVVIGADAAVLDGFTIRGGQADDASGHGGGMVNDGVAPAVTNVTFRDNWARASGAGVYNQGSSPSIVRCEFVGNTARFGAGMYNSDASPEIQDCTFRENHATTGDSAADPTVTQANGGGMLNSQGTPTITGSSFIGNDAATHGGGLVNNQSSAVIRGCTFEGNSAHDGGGVLNFESSASIRDSRFTANKVVNAGGGIFNKGGDPESVGNRFDQNEALSGAGMHNNGSSGVVIDCTFSENHAYQGGGMENWASSPLVRNCTFEKNDATFGGGMTNLEGSLSVAVRCQFLLNIAAAYGGGMYNENGSSPYVISSRFTHNGAAYGGAIANQGASPKVTNCVFEVNLANSDGGGIYSRGNSTLLITNSTFLGNPVLDANGLGRALSTVGSTLIVTNSILWDADDARNVVGNEQSLSTITYSTISGGCSTSCTSDPTGNLETDPQFTDLATSDFRLQANSPCVDAGRNDVVPRDEYDVDGDGNLDEPTPDADGASRVVGAAVDMGAYEHSP